MATYREIGNNGDITRMDEVSAYIKHGDMLKGVRDVVVTQAAGSDQINLTTIQGATLGALPPARPGGLVLVRAGGASADPGRFQLVGCLGVLIGTTLTVTGAANGDLTVVPATGKTGSGAFGVRFAMYVPGVNAAAVLTRLITVVGNEVIVRVATTNGVTVAGTETATSIAAALNANTAVAALLTATAGGTGAGLVAAQVAASRGEIPALGTYAAGPPATRSPGLAPVSYDGTTIFFPDTVTDAILNYDVAPYVNMETNYPPARP